MFEHNEFRGRSCEGGLSEPAEVGEVPGGNGHDGLEVVMLEAPFALALLRPDGCVERANRRFWCLLGAETADMPTGSLIAWVEPSQHAALSSALERLTKGELDELETDICLSSKRDRPLWALMIAWRAPQPGDSPTRVFCQLVDITERKEAELALRQTQRRFRDVAEVTYDQIWEMDDKFCFTYVYDPHNVPSFPAPEMQIGRRPWEIEGFEPFEPNGLSTYIDDLLHHRAFRDFRFSVIDPSGTKYYWRSSGRPVHDEAGSFVGYRGVSTNITGRTRAEMALQQSESRFRAVVDHSPVQIHIRDTDGRYLLWNREAASLFGQPESAVLGQRASQFLPPDIAAVLTADDNAVLVRGNLIEKEERLLLNDRLHTFLSVKFPIRGARDRVIGVGAISTDITERKAAEDRIRESELKYRQLYEVANDAIFTFDGSGRIQDVNVRGQQLLELERDEIIGRDYRELFSQFKDDEDFSKISENTNLEDSHRGEVTIISSKNSHIPVEVSWSVGEVKGAPIVQGIFRDISKRKQAEEALQESQEKVRQHASEVARIQRITTVSELASAFAHQINQPINAVANYTSVCLRQLDGGRWRKAQFQETLRLAHAQAQYAGKLVRELGDFIRKGKSAIAPHDLNAVLRSVLTLTEAEFWRLNVRVDTDLAPNLPKVSMEKIEVEQVVLNLLINAMEAITAGPSKRRCVKVTSAPADGAKLLVCICDSGPGISEEIRRDMFEPFASSKPDNLGMGLALSRSIITRHRGQLWAEPSSAGKGAEFCFTLPVD